MPYKENFSNDNFGSVSLFVNDLNKSSKYRNFLDIYGNTDLTPIKGFNYYNLENTLMHRLGEGDFFQLAAGKTGFDPVEPARKFDAILLDIDHAPDFHLAPAHAGLYQPDG